MLFGMPGIWWALSKCQWWWSWWYFLSVFCDHLRTQEVGWLTRDRQIPSSFLSKCSPAWGQGRTSKRPALKLRVLDLGRANQLQFLLSSPTVACDCIPYLSPRPRGGDLDSQSHSADHLASPSNWPTSQTLWPGPVIFMPSISLFILYAPLPQILLQD